MATLSFKTDIVCSSCLWFASPNSIEVDMRSLCSWEVVPAMQVNSVADSA